MKPKKNFIIVTTSLKGGVGKTQICASAATLFFIYRIPVITIDADIQQSLFRHRQRDLAAHPKADTPWDCVFLNTMDYPATEELIERAKQYPCCVFIDCPGNINDPSLQLIFDAADIAIVPFELNSDSVDATVIFAQLFKKHFNAKMFFVPNKVSALYLKRGDIRKAREDAMEMLDKKLGVVTPDIKLTTYMNGYSTLELLSPEKRKIIKEALNPILVPIWKLYNH